MRQNVSKLWAKFARMNQAHWHLFLSHFPVTGFLFLLPIFFYAWLKNEKKILKISLIATIFLSVISIPVFLSGEGAEEILEEMPAISGELIHSHEELGEWAFRLMVGSGFIAVLILGMNFEPKGKNKSYYVMLALLLLATTVINLRTSYLGGLIRHQEEIRHTPPQLPDH